MKPSARDNVIYLAVGLAIAGLVTFDFFYSDSHGHEMWYPTNFQFRLVAYLALLEYFVVRETRKLGATLKQVALFALVASVLHSCVLFGFRSTFAGKFTVTMYGLALLEIFAVVQGMAWTAGRLSRSRLHR